MVLVETYCLFLLLWHRKVGVGHGASMDFFGFLVRAARVLTKKLVVKRDYLLTDEGQKRDYLLMKRDYLLTDEGQKRYYLNHKICNT